MIMAADIARRAWALMQDEDGIRWEEPEIVDWINDAMAAIVIRRPMAHAKTETIDLEAGVLQRLANAVEILDVVRNLPGGPIRRTNRDQLEMSDPGWYDRNPTTRIVHYTFDDRKRTQFYVYPPAAAGTQVEALISRVPPKIATLTGEVDLGREYINPLVDYVCYRALTKDSEFANGQSAMVFYQAFEQGLGIHNQSSMAVSPNPQGGAE